MKSVAKNWLSQIGYRLTNARRRWGIDPLDDIAKIAKDCRSFRSVFDVGANEGQSALRFADFFPKATVTSFEPVQQTFAKLVQQTRVCPRINPINIALGNIVGPAEVSLFGDSGKSSLIGSMPDAMHRKAFSTQTIEVTTLDQYLSTNETRTIDLLKIDTEGYDIQVLRGAEETLDRAGVTFVFCEYHYLLDGNGENALGSLEEIAKYLQKFSYRFIASYTDSVHHNEPIGTYNVLFLAPSRSYRWSP